MSSRLKRNIRSRTATVGFVLGAVGAVGAAFGLGLADDGPQGPYSNALLPGEPAQPEDTTRVPTLAQGEVLEIGRFRLLPAGAVPSSTWAALPDDPRDERSVDLLDPAQVAQARRDTDALALSPAPVAPEGFTLSAAAAAWFPGVAGRSAWIRFEAYELAGDGLFPVTISARLAKQGASFDLVGYDNASGHGWSAGEVEGFTVLFSHGTAESKVQPSTRAFVFLGDYLVTVESIGLPPARMTAVVQWFIGAQGARLQRASVAVVEGGKR